MAKAAEKSDAKVGATPSGGVEPSHNMLRKFYRDMLMIRRFEERAGQLYGMGLIGGFCHSISARKRSSSEPRRR